MKTHAIKAHTQDTHRPRFRIAALHRIGLAPAGSVQRNLRSDAMQCDAMQRNAMQSGPIKAIGHRFATNRGEHERRRKSGSQKELEEKQVMHQAGGLFYSTVASHSLASQALLAVATYSRRRFLDTGICQPRSCINKPHAKGLLTC